MRVVDQDPVVLAAGVVRRNARLADGRELFYYDDPDSTLPPERAPDVRVLPPRPPTAHMRRDVLTGDWVTIATARQDRILLPPRDRDPLAPQSPGNPSEVPDAYDVVVFENRTPSFGPDLAEGPAGEIAGGRPAQRPSVGRCEVVCFSPDPEGSFGTQTPTRARTIIEALADRARSLSALPGIEQVFPFENRGEQIGVTLAHPHGQIYAYPFVTPRTSQLLRQIEAGSPQLLADVLDFERRGERVVLAGTHWTAYVPYAARWPMEVHVMPHRHVPDLVATDAAERDELAVLLLAVLRGIDSVYDTPTPYIAAWHQAPVRVGRDVVRLRLEITSPRRGPDVLKFLAGSESSMGVWVNDISPERAAEQLREAVAGHAGSPA